MLINLIKFHGLFKGLRRYYDEIVECVFFDLFNGVKTMGIKPPSKYEVNNFDINSHKHYQPTYNSPLKKIALFLKNKIKYKNVIIYDLGTGFGKPLIILGKILIKSSAENIKLIGVELDPAFKNTFDENLKKIYNNQKKININFENNKVEDINFNSIENETTLVIHNKNSFSKKITEENLNKIREISKTRNCEVFYIFSNPEFEDIFHEEIIFQNLGWHKNFNINLYKI